MIEIVPMAEEHINGVVTLEEATFSIPWQSSRLCRDVACSNRRTYHKRGRTGGGTL